MRLVEWILCLALGQDALDQLDSEDPRVRAQAADELVKRGQAALPALSKRIDADEIVERIVDDLCRRIEKEYAKPWFGCGEITFAPAPDEWARHFPKCRVLVGTMSCTHCDQLCAGEWWIGVSKIDGAVFTIRRTGRAPQDADPGDLRNYFTGDPELLRRTDE